jgi:hypothetical protein
MHSKKPNYTNQNQKMRLTLQLTVQKCHVNSLSDFGYETCSWIEHNFQTIFHLMHEYPQHTSFPCDNILNPQSAQA